MTPANVERRIARWLEGEEAGTHYPDRLLQATLEQTRDLRQVRPLFPWMVPAPRSWLGLARAAAVAVSVVVVASGALGLGVTAPSSTPRPSPDASAAPAPTHLRGSGEVLVFRARSGAGMPGWDIAAQDPATGAIRTVVATSGIVDCRPGSCTSFVRAARLSQDEGSIAFEVSFGGVDNMPDGPCGPTAGVWVQGPSGGPRQLTTPCATTPGADHIEELWAWSPDGSRLALARIDDEDDRLFLIDPADGSRRVLVPAGGGDPTALAWAPDGTRIEYAVDGSVFTVGLAAGGPSRLAGGLNRVLQLAYAPDGSQILLRDHDPVTGRERILVMRADGSDLRTLLAGEKRYDSTTWSPDGRRIVYELTVDDATRLYWNSEVWTIGADGSSRVEVFHSDHCNQRAGKGDALPAWAPNSVEVAYNACGSWVASNADGSSEPHPIDELTYRSWAGGGLSEWDLPGWH